jgi:hypothetical protein
MSNITHKIQNHNLNICHIAVRRNMLYGVWTESVSSMATVSTSRKNSIVIEIHRILNNY